MVALKNNALKEILKTRGVKNYSSANKETLLKMVESSGGFPHAAPELAPAPTPAPSPEPVKSPKKAKKVKVVEEPVKVSVQVVEEPVKKVKKAKKDKSPSPEKKIAIKKAKKSELKVEV